MHNNRSKVDCDCKQILTSKVKKILKGSLDLISSPSPSVKIQIMGRKVCLRHKGKPLMGIVNKIFIFKSLLTTMFCLYTFPAHNLNIRKLFTLIVAAECLKIWGSLYCISLLLFRGQGFFYYMTKCRLHAPTGFYCFIVQWFQFHPNLKVNN